MNEDSKPTGQQPHSDSTAQPHTDSETREISRAEFMKILAQSVVLVGIGVGGYETWTKVTSRLQNQLPQHGYPGKPWYAMGIDITKCIGCGMCVQACSRENDVPEGHFRTWIERYAVKKDGTVLVSSPDGGINGFADDIPDEDIEKSFFVPKLCNHCADSPCTQVCPVGATFRTNDGVVLIDYDYCVGCRYCIQACPYGSRFWNAEKHTADKCTMCYHRIKKGQVPACVEVCPVQARIFGDLTDPESPISKFIRDNPVLTLKPYLKTGAKAYYKGLSEEVV